MSIPEFVVRLCALVLIGLACVSTAGAQLPPEIQVDRLLVQAEREAEEGNPWTAASTLEQALEMYEEHGLEIPGDFWIRYAQALQAAGLHEEAIEASTRYLEESGREGEHYLTALRLLDEAEVGLAEDRREEARRRVEAQRAAEEAAAREAAILEAVLANLPDMVVIPAGTYRMGCVSGRQCNTYERPVHEVRVPSFALSRHEVTFARWDVCVEYGPCGWSGDEGWGRGDRPVIYVSWHEAQDYASWLSSVTGESYRLPSEAEWEYAARAGTETAYFWGSRIGSGNANTNTGRFNVRGTTRVGAFSPNAFGLYDMVGNIREWVQDCWNTTYNGAPIDGSPWEDGDCTIRGARGGTWGSGAESSRIAARSAWEPDRQENYLGFRLAKTIEP